MFKEVKVKSSAISTVSYDPETQVLRIQFARGAEYDYPNIPETEFRNLVSAPSVGRYYNNHIKIYTARLHQGA